MNAQSPMYCKDDGIVIFSNDSHSINAQEPIKVTDEGRFISINDLQCAKTWLWIVVNGAKIEILLSDEQWSKQFFPREVTEDGIVNWFNELQPKKV